MKYIQKNDKQIFTLIKKEQKRQQSQIRLIPSENYVSQAVLEATGSVLTNKYSEGYAHKRYYQGQEIIDQIEDIAKERAEKLFDVQHVNVQPYSGSPANLEVYLALLKPGDTIMGMALTSGGHLTHGSPVSYSGKLFNIVSYSVSEETAEIDYDELLKIAKKEKPKLIVAGFTAYPGKISFAKFRKIADEVGAYLHADISHISGLVVTGNHPSPSKYADTITTTTHKSLRGPRGAMIMCKSKYAKAIDKSVFPGMQGGPHNNTTAAIAVALKEAAKADFRKYAAQIIKNAQALHEALEENGFIMPFGKTETHLIVADVRPLGVLGKEAAVILEKAGIIVNFNTIPFDPNPPLKPSGIRIGTPALTTLGMKEKEMMQIANWMTDAIKSANNKTRLNQISREVSTFMKSFQYYS